MNACRGQCTRFSTAIPARALGQGWSGIKNGELLQRAEGEFDLFITSDQNMRYQQNLAGRRSAILERSTNDLSRIQSARLLNEEALAALGPYEFKQLNVP